MVYPTPSGSDLRVATYNTSLNRPEPGELLDDLSTPDEAQAQKIAQVLQASRPDVVLLNEFDDVPGVARAFQDNYLSVSQHGEAPINYPYVYQAPVNTGVASGVDLDGDGRAVTDPGAPGYANDALGFGQFPGQYGMLLLSRYPIVEEDVRTFLHFPWADMPDARLPDDPQTQASGDYYSPEALEVLPLSSKSHWDVPVRVAGETVHLLASHPTPPTFDGPEDRNGLRNADEIRFWADYVDPTKGDYIVDDAGGRGGLGADQRFVILGDQNVDPLDGDSLPGAAQQLTGHAEIAAGLAPESSGAVEAARTQGGDNTEHQGAPRFDTADFSEPSPGNLRVDYVLPSQAGLTRIDGGVVWPEAGTPLAEATAASDHRMIYADLALTDTHAARVQGVEFLGMTAFDSDTQFEGTTVGGLSGLTYLPASDSYLAISDDRSELNDARFYALRVDLSDGHLDDGDVHFTDVTTLRQNDGAPFAEGTIDPEAIDVSDDGTLYISSEGDARQGLAPSVGHYGRDGQQIGALALPQALMPDGEETVGIRNNLALESVTLTPDHTRLFTATENALVQDGPAADANTGSPARLLEFELGEHGAQHAYVYPTEPVPERPASYDGFSTNGLVELLALDDDHLLALERGFAEGVGNTVRLYEIDTERATDIQGLDALPEAGTAVRPVDKTLVADLGAFGVEPDNVEGMAFGPMLEDGRQSLILVSDDNFSDTQNTQFIALGLDVAPEAPTIPSTPTFDLSAFDAAIGRTLDLAEDALAPLFATAFGSAAMAEGIEGSASTLSGAFDFSAAGLEPLGLAPVGAEAFDLWGM